MRPRKRTVNRMASIGRVKTLNLSYSFLFFLRLIEWLPLEGLKLLELLPMSTEVFPRLIEWLPLEGLKPKPTTGTSVPAVKLIEWLPLEGLKLKPGKTETPATG